MLLFEMLQTDLVDPVAPTCKGTHTLTVYANFKKKRTFKMKIGLYECQPEKKRISCKEMNK